MGRCARARPRSRASALAAGSDSFYARLRLAIVAGQPDARALAPLIRQVRYKIARHDEDPELHLHLAMLLAAIGQGLSDRHWIEADPVLAPLRKLAAYTTLLARLDRRLQVEHDKLQKLLKAKDAALR